MRVEAPSFTKGRIVEGSVVVLAITSGTVLLAREASRRSKRLKAEAIEQSAGDGNHVTTLEEVKSRLG